MRSYTGGSCARARRVRPCDVTETAKRPCDRHPLALPTLQPLISLPLASDSDCERAIVHGSQRADLKSALLRLRSPETRATSQAAQRDVTSTLMRLLSRCVLLLALLLALAVPSPAALPAPPRPFAVVGYLPEWRYSGASFDSLFEHLSHLIFFSVEPAGDGTLTGLDRLPGVEVLAAAQEARRGHGTRLLLCLGGNGRSNGFSYASRDPAARARLAASIADAVVQHGLDGWDANWEYPGFSFSGGYKTDDEVEKDWDGLATLLRESRTALQAAFAAAGRIDEPIITLAYYPDGRQERELAKRGLVAAVDLMHAMAYDAPGEDHSPFALAEQVVANAREQRERRLDHVRGPPRSPPSDGGYSKPPEGPHSTRLSPVVQWRRHHRPEDGACCPRGAWRRHGLGERPGLQATRRSPGRGDARAHLPRPGGGGGIPARRHHTRARRRRTVQGLARRFAAYQAT